MFGAFISRIKRKSLIHLYVTICMKLDPGMHIGLHLIFYGKTGVTTSLSASCEI
jgi:hypothetical protein